MASLHEMTPQERERRLKHWLDRLDAQDPELERWWKVALATVDRMRRENEARRRDDELEWCVTGEEPDS